MVFYDMQELGGLEEYATTLAEALQDSGNEVSVLSTAWVPPSNQYLQRLRANQIDYVEPPRWLSSPASDWSTKERILGSLMRLFSPVVYLTAALLYLLTSRSWTQSLAGAHGWLQGRLGSIIKPDWRKPIVRSLLNWWRIRRQPDLLHIQGYTSNLLFVIDWAHEHDLPVVYEEHQTPVPDFDWWEDFPASINKATTVVAVSETSAEGLRTVCGVTRPIVVRNPLLLDPKTQGWQSTERVRHADDPIAITTVARLDIAKGLTYLLEAIVQVQAVHAQAEFRVYGSGRLRQELLDYANQLGLDGERIFVGAFNHQDLGSIMDRTDLFVMSSILEGQPLALIEAMAYGCPIVTTDVGGIPEMITDGVNGMLCRPADPNCLAQKICTLIDDPGLRRNLGREARRTFEQGPLPAGFAIEAVQRRLRRGSTSRSSARRRHVRMNGEASCPYRPLAAGLSIFHC